jgi:hypothetical protein
MLRSSLTTDQRFERLERQLSSWRRGTAVCIVSVVVLFASAARRQERIDRLDVDEVRVFRGDKLRIRIGGTPEIGDSVIIVDENLLPQVGMMVHAGGNKTIALDDPRNRCAMSLLMRENGSFAMHYGGDKKSGFSLVGDENTSFLRFHDKNRKVRAKLGLDDSGSPVMEFYDQDEKLTFKVPER